MYGAAVQFASVKNFAAAPASAGVLPPLAGGISPAPMPPELEMLGVQGPLAADELSVRAAKNSRDHPIHEHRRQLPYPRRQVRVAMSELRPEPRLTWDLHLPGANHGARAGQVHSTNFMSSTPPRWDQVRRVSGLATS
jgi:hypothetical protein